jgi:phenylalanyl-tRNA synthetase beta chain
MRTSLLPGLAANLQRAQRQQLKSFASFELARVFRPRPSEVLPDEAHEFGFLLWGQRGHWYGEGEPYDFYDAKAAATSVVHSLSGRDPETHEDAALDHEAPELHPKRRARLVLAGQTIGMLGELHPDVVQAAGLEGRPVWCRIEVASLAAAVAQIGPTRATGMPRYPSATRDLAVVVAEDVMAGQVASVLREAAGPLAEEVRLFDLYRGEPVPAGHKSLAFRVVYRDTAATLTDKLVDELHGKLLRAAQERFAASIRR